MNKISVQEGEALQKNASDIYVYKCMRSTAYSSLALKAEVKITHDLLSEIHTNELNDADDWIKNMSAFNIDVPQNPPSFLNIRVRLMMLILGPRGFLEWVLIAEDENVEAMSINVGNIQEKGISDILIRIVSDERLHVNKMKKEVLGMESWEMGGGGGVRDVIFGANDGLVSILALVAVPMEYPFHPANRLHRLPQN